MYAEAGEYFEQFRGDEPYKPYYWGRTAAEIDESLNRGKKRMRCLDCGAHDIAFCPWYESNHKCLWELTYIRE